MVMWERFDAVDRQAFLVLNGIHSPWADEVMWLVSAMATWFPIYLLFLYLLQRRYGWRGLLWSVPVIALMVLCSDKGSVVLFKETVQRLRPCHEPALAGLVHTVREQCGGSFGFVSSHASNHFAIAAFMSVMLQGTPRWAAPALLFWAALVAYSRVYLGVHYPGDVLVGALYGGVIGLVIASIFHRSVLRPLRP